jgi:hypothetical protein
VILRQLIEVKIVSIDLQIEQCKKFQQNLDYVKFFEIKSAVIHSLVQDLGTDIERLLIPIND